MKAGDEAALELLFSKYYGRLCAFVCRFVNEYSVAEEIVADLFILIWTKRSNLNIQSIVLGYLQRSARNSALRFIRSKKITTEKYPEDFMLSKHWKQVSPEHEMIAKERWSLLQDEIARMPKQRRSVFIMAKIEGREYSEISERMKLSKPTVKNHLYAALQSIPPIFKEPITT